ncbi:MAG: four helix bundle protein [Candidatus Poseidoniia archaeon]|jgi:four helix bundle protein|nr:four helix bundle protein [Candidatus Poseidoniia archaeon]HCI03505.1 four helix bundle protein [Candidatus Peribacteria bacterium]|tara:strand:+ start:2090 stop:2452 length:363 start_codon:yes stop_codon:yes gene_type:complete
MTKDNPIRDKSYNFALHIVDIHEILISNKEFVLGKQILKSGTSIGANVEEALQGQSTKDFVSKLSISLKEAHETFYWLRILRDKQKIESQTASTLLDEAEELIKLLTSIIKTSKRSLVNQ